MNRTRIALAASMLTLLGSAPMLAQNPCFTNNCTVSVPTSVTVNDVLKLSLSSITTLDLGTPSNTDYDAGFKDAADHRTATVYANRAWKVDVVGAASKFGYTPGAPSLVDPNKPSSDLLWAKTSGGLGTTTNNMGSSTTLFSNTTGNADTNQDIYFRTKWAWNKDVPGQYTLTVNFTLSAP